MKKISAITSLMMCTLLFFGNISTAYAEEVHSKVTGTLVQPDEPINTMDADEPGANALKLPQTGETIKWGISIVGILLVVVSLVVILMKRRRNNNENK